MMSKTLKLIALSGLPATGKSTLARRLSQHFQFPMFSKDHFESILHKNQLSNGSSLNSYDLLLETANLQLSLGLSVIVDAVFPLQGFRDSLRGIALQHQAQLYVLHTHCSDEALHKKRLLERPIHVPWEAVDWERIQEIKSIFIAWSPDDALSFDMVDSLESNFERSLDYMRD